MFLMEWAAQTAMQVICILVGVDNFYTESVAVSDRMRFLTENDIHCLRRDFAGCQYGCFNYWGKGQARECSNCCGCYPGKRCAGRMFQYPGQGE